jgi:hypothetical protein
MLRCMKIKIIALLVVLSATSALAAGLPRWMVGSWQLDGGGMHVEEHWTADDGGIMLGMSKTVPEKGKTTFEFLRITEVDGRLAYLAMPQGRPATVFPLKTAEATRLVFENPEHDFPQRILYWRSGEQLCARIEGMLEGKPAGEEWCYARMAEK